MGKHNTKIKDLELNLLGSDKPNIRIHAKFKNQGKHL